MQQPQQTAKEEQLSIAEQLQIYQLFEEAKRRSAAAMQPQNVPITSQQPSTIASPKKEYVLRKQQNQPTLGRQIDPTSQGYEGHSHKRIEERQRVQTERRLAAINKNSAQAVEQVRNAQEEEELRQEARKAEEKKIQAQQAEKSSAQKNELALNVITPSQPLSATCGSGRTETVMPPHCGTSGTNETLVAPQCGTGDAIAKNLEKELNVQHCVPQFEEPINTSCGLGIKQSASSLCAQAAKHNQRSSIPQAKPKEETDCAKPPAKALVGNRPEDHPKLSNDAVEELREKNVIVIDRREGRKFPKGDYLDSGKHGKKRLGDNGRRPDDGVAAHEDSHPVIEKYTDQETGLSVLVIPLDHHGLARARIAVQNGEFIILKSTNDGTYHGFVKETWEMLTPAERESCIEFGLTDKNGKILK